MSEEPVIRHFEGREQYEVAIDELLPQARSCIRVFDREIPVQFGSARRTEVLRGFLRADRHRRLRILAHDPAKLAAQCPRLIALLRQYAHAVAIHQTPDEAARIYDPFCVADATGYVRRFHFDDARGVTSFDDQATAGPLVSRFDEMWELSNPALSATVLGL